MTNRDEILAALVDLVLAARAEYLAGGGKPLKHWDQLQSRLLVAARSSRDLRDFATRFGSGLRLGAPSTKRARATETLHGLVGDSQAWLREVPREIAFILAAARLRAEAQRERGDGRQGNLFGAPV